MSSPVLLRRMVLLLVVLSPGVARGAEDFPHFIEPDEATGSSAAVVVGDQPLVHTTQVLPLDDAGRIAADTAEAQAARVLENLDRVLAAAQSELRRVVKLNVYMTRQESVADVQRTLARRFRGSHKPAVSYVVTSLPDAAALVAADAVATTTLDPGRAVVLVGEGEQRPPGEEGKTPAESVRAAAAVAPTGARIYIAGQAERSESLAEATRNTLESLRNTLRFLGRSDTDIVQLKAFLAPMADAAVVQREVAACFPNQPTPPLALVEWKSAANLPIEIELVAWGGSNRTGEAVEYLTPPGMTASPVFSRVARINHAATIFVSGLYASPADAAVDPHSPAAGEREVQEVFATLERILKQAGSDLRHLVKATYYVSTNAASAKLNELRPKYYDPQRPPSASKAVVAGVGRPGLGLTIDMIAVPTVKDATAEYGPAECGHGLSPEDAAAGWISLFDGRTTFGWTGAKAEGGELIGGDTTTEFGDCELRATLSQGGVITAGGQAHRVERGEFALKETATETDEVSPIRLSDGARITHLAVRPRELQPLFNGRDLSEWKRIDHPSIAEDKRPVWQITDGAIRGIGGPGCIEYQGRRFGDLVLQLDARTRVRHGNGGVFFRAIPGDFMNGYEAQVFNRSENGDPDRPAVWSSGAIDDRQNARRLVSRDGQFFRMTIIARGPRIATWVNGYQQTDFIDDRPPHANPRQGLRTEPGVIQLQAHDRDSDLEFKNIAASP